MENPIKMDDLGVPPTLGNLYMANKQIHTWGMSAMLDRTSFSNKSALRFFNVWKTTMCNSKSSYCKSSIHGPWLPIMDAKPLPPPDPPPEITGWEMSWLFETTFRKVGLNKEPKHHSDVRFHLCFFRILLQLTEARTEPLLKPY